MTNLIQRARLVPAARALPARHTTPLPHLARVRLLTGAQLDRLLANPTTTSETTARDRRRTMTRLVSLGLVTTLERRIGGARAGSAGHIYTLTPTGHRYVAIIQGQPCPPRRSRPPSTPGALFLGHMLAISEVYVQLVTTSRDCDDVQLIKFTTEPACWQPTRGGQFLKPDAYLRLATATHADCWWLEVDQATESLPRITRKCRDYLDYLTHSGEGPDQVPPRILFTAPDEPRTQAIKQVIKKMSTQEVDFINVTTHTNAPTFLINQLFTE
ncbi:MAG: replication-relaxation family protein [Pseudonocardiales bacterium]|nr:replication-relaxation family protein [Pseudonocardiales bacterium]